MFFLNYLPVDFLFLSTKSHYSLPRSIYPTGQYVIRPISLYADLNSLTDLQTHAHYIVL